ncbi:MAG: hypothetical protein DMG12_16170 [Acidobacteria bacterium]|nr:MAG: hypothetical protein DMG12_16170 [Acidobacteriota bacterium]
MMLLLLLSIPAMASGLISLSRKRRVMEWIHASASVGALIVGGVLAVGIRDGAPVSSWDILRADALSAFMIMIVAFVGAVAGIYAIGYTRLEFDDGHIARVRLFYALFQLFVFTMLLAVTTDNLGVMWVAIEGTTLATVFLVNIHDNHTGLEAAYKYLIISSVGIALAFMGTVLMYYAATAQVGEIGLSWTSLIGIAARLDPKIVKLAFVFILIGYGTKAGLAPMHTWLPDAHSEAPAPISALMSGVLLNVGLYALMRFKAVTDITHAGLFERRAHRDHSAWIGLRWVLGYAWRAVPYGESRAGQIHALFAFRQHPAQVPHHGDSRRAWFDESGAMDRICLSLRNSRSAGFAAIRSVHQRVHHFPRQFCGAFCCLCGDRYRSAHLGFRGNARKRESHVVWASIGGTGVR